MENRCKNDVEIDQQIIIEADNQNIEFLLPVETGSSKMRFHRVPNPLKIDEKSVKKVGSFPDRSWDRFLRDFCCKLDGFSESSWRKNWRKFK